MTVDVHELFAFVEARCADDTKSSLAFRESVQSGALPGSDIGVSKEAMLRHAESKLRGDQAIEQLLATTIKPYVGQAGEAGRNAEHQLRLLAVQYDLHRDYHPKWRPDAPEYPRLTVIRSSAPASSAPAAPS